MYLNDGATGTDSNAHSLPQTLQLLSARNSRIIGGSETAADAHPYLVIVQHYNEMEERWLNVCAGTIVKSDIIVTTGTCAYVILNRKLRKEQKWRVVAGEHELFKVDGTEQYRSIASVVYHPQFIM